MELPSDDSEAQNRDRKGSSDTVEPTGYYLGLLRRGAGIVVIFRKPSFLSS
jgi:hypothetical protein